MTPEEAEQTASETQDRAEQLALMLFASAAPANPELSDSDTVHLSKLYALIVASLIRMTGAVLTAPVKAALILKLISMTRDYLHSLRQANAAAPPRDPGELSLQRQAAIALAQRAQALAMAEFGALVAEDVTFGRAVLKKVWVTRGDTRVRPLHRKLHGKIKRWDEDFWRWPATGQRLRHPGDPHAPLDATINCRCVCFLSWASHPYIKAAHQPLAWEQ